MGKRTESQTHFIGPVVDDDDLPLPEHRLYDDDGKFVGDNKKNGDSEFSILSFLRSLFDAPREVEEENLPRKEFRASPEKNVEELFPSGAARKSGTPNGRSRSKSGTKASDEKVPGEITPVPKSAVEESPKPKTPVPRGRSASQSKSKRSRSESAAPESIPNLTWTVDELKSFAAKEGVSLGAAKSKAEIMKRLKKSISRK
jgi:hypothetical protein